MKYLLGIMPRSISFAALFFVVLLTGFTSAHVVAEIRKNTVEESDDPDQQQN